MAEDTGVVQWVGRQAVVTFPRHIGSANADQVRERLLWVINRSAVVLIADLTPTVSCDYSGADVLVQAYQHAVASGTELRLVVSSGAVRRAIGLNGLDRLIPPFPTLLAAFAAGRNGHQPRQEPERTPLAPVPAGAGQPPPPAAADPHEPAGYLLDSAVGSIFSAALSLQDAPGLPREVILQRVAGALGLLDDALRDIRGHAFTAGRQEHQPGAARWQPPEMSDHLTQTTQRTALLRQRLAETQRALHASAAQTAALMLQRASLLEEPQHVDYPTKIKSWRVVAGKAQQLAESWEEHPQPDG